MNIGALLRAGAGGVIAADESRKDRTRELLIESQRQRQEQQREMLSQAQTRKYEQDATYDAQDRVVKESERARKEVADAAEQSRREQALPIRVRLARELVPEFRDVTKYDDQTLQSYVADEDNWKTIASRQGKREAPVMGDPEWQEAKRFEAQLGAQYRAPREPRNIDPLSPQGVAARRQLESGTETTRLPDGTVVQGKPPKITEGQGKASVNVSVAEAEEAAISAMSNSLPNKYTDKIPVIGNIMTGKFNPEFQAQKAAGERWITQYLRFQSGAAISKSEFESARDQYIPQPGDSPATVRAKAEARRRVVEGIKSAAGPASPGSGAGPSGPTQRRTGPPLSAAQKARAASDPEYAAFLRAKGQ